MLWEVLEWSLRTKLITIIKVLFKINQKPKQSQIQVHCLKKAYAYQDQ